MPGVGLSAWGVSPSHSPDASARGTGISASSLGQGFSWYQMRALVGLAVSELEAAAGGA